MRRGAEGARAPLKFGKTYFSGNYIIISDGQKLTLKKVNFYFAKLIFFT